MNYLQAALNLNNRAVENFQYNCIPEAASMYYQSLCILNQVTRVVIAHDETKAPNTIAQPKQECFHSSTQPSITILMQEDSFLVYQSALILQESASCSSQNGVFEAMNIYCAGILFNTGILQHQDWIKTGKSRSMDKAQHLYQSSLQLLNALPNSAKSNETVTLLMVVNNNNSTFDGSW